MIEVLFLGLLCPKTQKKPSPHSVLFVNRVRFIVRRDHILIQYVLAFKIIMKPGNTFVLMIYATGTNEILD